MQHLLTSKSTTTQICEQVLDTAIRWISKMLSSSTGFFQVTMLLYRQPTSGYAQVKILIQNLHNLKCELTKSKIFFLILLTKSVPSLWYLSYRNFSENMWNFLCFSVRVWDTLMHKWCVKKEEEMICMLGWYKKFVTLHFLSLCGLLI